MSHSKISTFVAVLITAVVLSACNGIKTEASYPDRQKGTDKIIYSDQKRETIWAEDDSLTKKLFGDGEEETSGSGGIGVNSFLWRATLDTISFAPVASADPFGGVVITDWYENPEIKGERFKLNVYILDKQLRADAIKVAVFKQKLIKNNWRDIKVAKTIPLSIENTILTRARELRIAQIGAH